MDPDPAAVGAILGGLAAVYLVAGAVGAVVGAALLAGVAKSVLQSCITRSIGGSKGRQRSSAP